MEGSAEEELPPPLVGRGRGRGGRSPLSHLARPSHRGIRVAGGGAALRARLERGNGTRGSLRGGETGCLACLGQ